MRNVFLASLGFGLLTTLLACGAVADDSNGSPGGGGTGQGSSGGTNPPPGVNPPLDPIGSFDVTFTNVDVTAQTAPTPPGTDPPSRTVKSRLDIRKSLKNPNGYEAVFTSRWGDPSELSVSVSAEALTLSGGGTVFSTAGAGGVTDTWKSITLARDAKGQLTGEMTATGDEMISEGDEVWEAKISGSAKIVRDATNPEVRANIGGLAGSGQLLPWESFDVQAAEPVGRTAAEDAMRVVAPSGSDLSITFPTGKLPATDWAGETRFVARATDWTTLVDASFQLQSSNATDLVGRTAALLKAPISFISVGSAQQQIGFDDDVMFAHLWGTYEVYGGGLVGTNDPRCEAGGCARLGPMKQGTCAPTASGFAALLSRQPLGDVELRYRVLAKPAYPTDPTPFLYGPVVTLELASASTDAVDSAVTNPTMTPLASPIDGFTHASDWTTLSAPAPGSGVIGVAVALGSGASNRSGCGGPPVPQTDIEILVESVKSK
jgi:hypothetical protein